VKSLLLGGIIAGPVFLVVSFLEGFRAGYDPVRMPISLLSAGPDGWTQVANFFVAGSLVVAGAVGLATTRSGGRAVGLVGPALLAIFGLGIIGAGLFSTDPALGYPPGIVAPLVATDHGSAHDLVSLVVFVDLPIACLVVAFRFVRQRALAWGVYSAATALVLIVVLATVIVAFNTRSPLADIGGLLQRVWLLAGFGWLRVLSLHAWRHRAGVAVISAR